MAAAFVNATATFGTTNSILPTSSYAATTGNALVAWTRMTNGQRVDSMTDTAGNLYNRMLVSCLIPGQTVMEAWIAFSITGHSLNITSAYLDAATNSSGVGVMQVSGVNVIDCLTWHRQEASNTCALRRFTTRYSAGIILGFGMVDVQNSSWAQPSGYTLGVVSNNSVLMGGYKVYSSQEVGVTPSWSTSGTDTKTLFGVALTEIAAGGAGAGVPHLINGGMVR
jgi:hypothetical protein